MGQLVGRPAPPPPVGRRVFHLIAASSTALLSLAMAQHAYMPLIGGGALLALAIEASRLRSPRLNGLYLAVFGPILKQSESAEITGATWFLIAAFFTFFFYGPAVALPVLLFVAIGDPAAALVGSRCPGPRFRGKSPGGIVAFAAGRSGGLGNRVRRGLRPMVVGDSDCSSRRGGGGVHANAD